MVRRLIAALVMFSSVFFAAAPGHAAGTCGDRVQLAGILEARYAEHVAFVALTDDGNLMEIYTSQKGTWTAIVTTPAGTSCVVATGTSWEGIRDVKSYPAA